MKQARIWLASPKYLHILLNPSASAILNQSRRDTAAKMGTAITKRFARGLWSMWKKSAIISLALLRAVSPVVIGAATTPSMANMLPKVPSQYRDTEVTTSGACADAAPASCIPPSKKNQEETAAQIRATMPSVIIAP